ncbi:MauE/DoxX family redox-associated membrane protein [Fodinicola feengrottensis]|uniref:Methylamine utilisation protein MauE domain-containing protein n=1 Tax=Fodinicola feengrottensis TaxID=435914 RepID=A0ABN2IHL6_9ACTN|nr:MauE/DoxX family redox-associated membrane protein [Fodinicola feengrottensis]
MIALLDVALRFGAALVLLYAATQKLAAPRPFRQTLQALRVPFAAAVAIVVPLVEIAAAIGLTVAPGGSAALVAALGFAFAGAAVVAMSRGERIRCACYGSTGDATLGWRQLAALPLWLVVALDSFLAPDHAWSGIGQFAGLTLALAVVVAGTQLLAPMLRNRAYLRVLQTQAAGKNQEMP